MLHLPALALVALVRLSTSAPNPQTPVSPVHFNLPLPVQTPPDDSDTGNNLIVALQKIRPVKLGSVSAAEVFDSLNDHCSQTTCQSDPWELDAFYIDHTSQSNQGTIKVTAVDATFRNNSVADLVEILKAFADEGAAESKEVTYTSGSNCIYPNPNGGTCDLGEERTMDIWSTSGDWDIRIEGDDEAVKDHLRLSLEFETGEDAFLKAFCKALTAAGGALYGTLGASAAAIGSGFALTQAICELA